MHFAVRALPADQFADWTRATRAAGQVLDTSAYARLARQSTNVPPAAYAGVDPALFHKIVLQQLPPGPGPDTSTPALAISPK
jgi:cytochrome o ubiquinol oxidase subunit 2